MIVWIFPVLATFGVCVAYFLKYLLSGKDLGLVGLFSCVFFNGFFAVSYINIIEEDDFVFLGNRPDLIVEYPFIGWIAFVCILLHTFALPIKD